MSILYRADADRGREWKALFAELAPDLPAAHLAGHRRPPGGALPRRVAAARRT